MSHQEESNSVATIKERKLLSVTYTKSYVTIYKNLFFQ